MLIFSLAVPLTFMASLKKLEGEYVLSVQAYIHRIVASFGINPRVEPICLDHTGHDRNHTQILYFMTKISKNF